MSGTLYVVATPLGNLEDITLRALRILREVGLIAAEDTRHTRKLLSHLDIHTPLTSYHGHSGPAKRRQILETLAVGHDVALVSDAGTPGIADPGQPLIAEAVAAAIPVVPIPGPNAAITALSVAAFPESQHCFLGFLPRRQTRRERVLRTVAALPFTLVLYESPYRLLSCLETCQRILGDREVVIARELTKLHEELLRGRLSDIAAHFSRRAPQGEFVLVIRGTSKRGAQAKGNDDGDEHP